MRTRIAMISEHASPLAALGGVDSGGQNVYVAQVARHLGRRGYHVDVFTRRDNPSLDEIVELSDAVRVIHVPAGPPAIIPKEEMLPYMDDFAAWMLQFCREEEDYALAHANFFMSGLVGLRLRQALGTPLVVTFHALGRVRLIHQGDTDRFPPERVEIEEQIVAEADRIIAECPQDEDDQVRYYGADPAKIRIVPCGFDESEFSPVDKTEARNFLGLDPRERLIVHVGRLVPRKGVDNVIRGLARLVRVHRTPARLLIVGGESDVPDPRLTPEIGRLQAVARDEDVAERVTFTGRRGREVLRYYYSAGDVFVTTPWYEPFGITPVESMACGSPVIGSRVGGIKFTVRDGHTGYLVPPNDPQALGDRLAGLYQNPDYLSRFSRQALRRVNNWFTWRYVAREIASVYDEVLSEVLVA